MNTSPLTVSFANECIDKVLAERSATGIGLRLRRLSKPDDAIDADVASGSIPYFFGIGLFDDDSPSSRVRGVVTVYMAYSTWDGRCLFVDRLDLPDPGMEVTVLRPLAKIAINLGCARLNWKRVSRRKIDCSWNYFD